jgi:error-prone DNA polymerase
MVHPYLKRRADPSQIEYPRPAPPHPQDELEKILRKTMGVPLFQEQAMRIAIEGAGFSDDDADGLRRAMATFRHHGNVGEYGEKFMQGMLAKGYDEQFTRDCFGQIEGFGSYGFPESHAISFALLVYASAWVKKWWPDAFCASLLNSQPMGFYQPAQLVRDAREHGVEVRPPDVAASTWDCLLEPVEGRRLRAVRLGLREIKGLKEEEARRLVELRAAGVRSIEGFARGLSHRTLELLAEADAFAGLGVDRRQALWAVKGLAGTQKEDVQAPLLSRQSLKEVQVELPLMSATMDVAEDYRTTRLSLKAHPCSFFRDELVKAGAVPAQALKTIRDRRWTSVGGLVLVRQRPGTAKGVVFMTLEDETGVANIVVWKDVFDANRRLVMSGSFLVVHGQVQSESGVVHLVAKSFTDLSHLHAGMKEDDPAPDPRRKPTGRLVSSRDFH